MDLNDRDTYDKLSDDGLFINIDASHHFKVRENPTTGYEWSIRDTCQDLVLVNESFDAP